MPSANERLTPEQIEALLEIPAFASDAERVAKLLLDQVEYAIRWKQELPPLAVSMWRDVMRGIQHRKESAREREANQQYQQMRQFIQLFRNPTEAEHEVA